MNKKEFIHYCCAVGMIIFGCCMCVASFALSVEHKVDESVLWILGQSLLFSGSIFGVGLYVNARVEANVLQYRKEGKVKSDKIICRNPCKC